MSRDKKKTEKHGLQWWGWLAIYIALAILIFFVWSYTKNSLMLEPDAVRGINGDMFGGLNALFSGLAFAGIILTIIMQGIELKAQREELEQTRNVFQMQNFETSFYNLLKVLQETLKDTSFQTKPKSSRIGSAIKYNGLGAYAALINEFQEEFYSSDLTEEKHQAAIERRLTANVNMLRYCKLVIRILLMVQELESDDQNKYLDTMYYMLTEPEKAILLYYSYMVKNQDEKEILMLMDILDGIRPKLINRDEKILLYYSSIVSRDGGRIV
jgi:hypothetical protein